MSSSPSTTTRSSGQGCSPGLRRAQGFDPKISSPTFGLPNDQRSAASRAWRTFRSARTLRAARRLQRLVSQASPRTLPLPQRPNALGRALPVKQSLHGHVFVKGRPVNANAWPDQLPPCTFARRPACQTGIPSERHRHNPPVTQRHDQEVAGHPHIRRSGALTGRRSTHAMPFECRLRAAPPTPRPCEARPPKSRGCTRPAQDSTTASRPSDREPHERAPVRRGRSRRRTGGTDHSVGPWGSPNDCASFRLEPETRSG